MTDDYPHYLQQMISQQEYEEWLADPVAQKEYQEYLLKAEKNDKRRNIPSTEAPF